MCGHVSSLVAPRRVHAQIRHGMLNITLPPCPASSSDRCCGARGRSPSTAPNCPRRPAGWDRCPHRARPAALTVVRNGSGRQGIPLERIEKLRICPMLEQQANHVGAIGEGRFDQRRIAIARLQVQQRTRPDEQFDDAGVAAHNGGPQRPIAAAAGVRIGVVVQQIARHFDIAVERRVDQRAPAQFVLRIGLAPALSKSRTVADRCVRRTDQLAVLALAKIGSKSLGVTSRAPTPAGPPPVCRAVIGSGINQSYSRSRRHCKGQAA